jgi:apolipoprotein N-acyltransferase
LAGRLIPFLVAGLAGLVQAAAIAWPWNGQPSGWLQLVSLAVLAWLLQAEPSWRRAGALAWCFATAWLTATFWWLFVSMHFYGGLAAPLAALAVLLLATFLASYYAIGAAAVAWLAPRGPLGAAIALACAWTLAELARGSWFTGFPWGAGGYAHVDGPLAALAPWIGVYGIGLVAALAAALAAAVARYRSLRAGLVLAGGAIAVAALTATASPDSMPSAGTAARPLAVALLQGNIPQDEKFQGGTGIPLALHWYGQQLRDAKASLVVAPETALPLLPQQLPEGYLAALERSFADGTRAALIGLPLGSFEQGYTNSTIGLRDGSTRYRYDKHHLVPFGEFIPPLFKWFTRMMNIPLGDFNRGAVGQPSFEWQGERFAPNVCYEDLFGEELAARFADPAKAPTVFVNVSNIAWFGDTIAIDQHLQISRMRAIEFERPMLRATNTGATVAIDHRGSVTHALPRLTRGVLLAQVQGRTGLTPYAAWASRWGLWPLGGLALAVLAALAYAGRRRPPARA